MEAYKILISKTDDFDRDHYFTLDLAANLSLQFTNKNCVFDFANSEVNRSVGFNVPATPNNNRIFNFAKDPAKYGERMRIKLPARLQYSGGTQDGYLYAQTADENTYKCVFVFGELFGLAAIKDAGKLGNFVQPFSSALLWQTTTTQPQDANSVIDSVLANLGEYNIVKYIDNNKDERWDGENITTIYPPMPSVELYDLLIRALADLGISHNLTKQAEDYTLRIVPPAKRATFGTARIEQTQHDIVTFTLGTEPNFGVSEVYWQRLYGFQFRNPNSGVDGKCVIKFGESVPSDVFLGMVLGGNGSYFSVKPCGDYKATSTTTSVGTPLAGNEFEIDTTSGNMYRLYRMADYLGVTTDGNILIDQSSNEQASFDVSFDIMQPQKFYYLYEYPAIAELDLMQLILTYAHLRGYLVTWQNNTLMFISLQFVDEEHVYIDECTIKWSDLSRKFADFAQHNIVRLGGDKEVGLVDYTVPNEILKTEDTLFESDFTAGEYTPDYAQNYGYLEDAEQDGSEWKPTDFDAAIFQCTADSVYMKVAALTKNNVLQLLCTTSTQIKVRLTMILSKFFGLRYNSSFQLRGKRYAWTEAQWSGGICTATLQQLA